MNGYFVSYNELWVIVLIGVVVGALFGLVPLMLGRRRNKARLGMYGFIASIVAGAIAPLLSIIVTAIFSWVIVKSGAASTDGSDATGNAPSTDSASE